jgi:hypothetical protein
MKLTTMTQVTVDGVMQGDGGASDEDRRSGFERSGWAMGVFDEESMRGGVGSGRKCSLQG